MTFWIGLTPAGAADTELRARFLAAEAALAAGRSADYRSQIAALRDYPLYFELAVAELLARLEQASAAEVRALLARAAATAPGERLRQAWLDRLARERRWAEYVADYADTGSLAHTCRYRYALLQLGHTAAALAEAATLFRRDDRPPPVCHLVFAAAVEAGTLPKALVWRRSARLLAQDDLGAAEAQRRYLPADEHPWFDHWLAVHRDPEALLTPPPGSAHWEAAILAHGIARLARQAPARAAAVLTQVEQSRALAPAVSAAARVALGLALADDDPPARALSWLRAPLENAALPDEESWLELHRRRLRVGLRLRAWAEVPGWIAALPEAERERAEWQYWLGRALEQTGAEEAARAAWARAAQEREFWGFLAAERGGHPPTVTHRPVPVAAADLAALEHSVAAARLRELHALGRDAAVTREWRAFTRERTGPALLAAAVLAHRLELPHLAIFTLARSGYWDDLELRFPLLYRPLVRTAAVQTGLPEEWLLAVIRQESAFAPHAVSSAGAVGLMQLLPSTAREVAQRARLAAPSAAQLRVPARNLDLGSRYLAQLYAQFARHTVVATAAYNAGPGRVRRWLPPGPMSADLWIATIPLRETRDYVARVLGYRFIYAHRLGTPVPQWARLLAPISATMRPTAAASAAAAPPSAAATSPPDSPHPHP